MNSPVTWQQYTVIVAYGGILAPTALLIEPDVHLTISGVAFEVAFGTLVALAYGGRAWEQYGRGEQAALAVVVVGGTIPADLAMIQVSLSEVVCAHLGYVLV